MPGFLKRHLTSESVRSFVFGVEDSLVSTVGFVTGIAVTGAASETVVLSGVILIFVEAFSMAIGEFLSASSAREYEAQKSVPLAESIGSGLVMFVSYILSGLLILVPYMLFVPGIAVKVSVSVSLLALFVLGVVSASLSNGNKLKKGALMLLAGGAAIAIGIFIGSFFSV